MQSDNSQSRGVEREHKKSPGSQHSRDGTLIMQQTTQIEKVWGGKKRDPQLRWGAPTQKHKSKKVWTCILTAHKTI